MDEMVNAIVDEVRWRYDTDRIARIDTEAVQEVISDLYPNYREDGSDIVFRVMMAV